jgi:hypothetical protein
MDLINKWYTRTTNGDMLERPIDIENIVRL